MATLAHSPLKSWPRARTAGPAATPDGLQLGANFVSLVDVTAYRVDEKVEDGPRLGNIIMLNLFIAAVVAFLLGIFSEYLKERFYLAVVLFTMLAGAAFDDVINSRRLVFFRLTVVRGGKEGLAFVTPDEAAMQAVAGELDRRGLPRLD